MAEETPATVGEVEALDAPDMPADPKVPTHPEGIVKELPCGLVKDGELHRWTEFVPMSGFTRRSISKKDIRDDFSKVSEMVLRQCVKRIGTVPTTSTRTLDNTPMGDRDFLLMEIRRASMGDELNAIVICVLCKKKIRVTFHIDELDIVRLESGDYEIINNQLCFRIESAKPAINAICRFPIGGDQGDMLPIIETNPTEAQYRLFSACLIDWNGNPGPFDYRFFDDLSTKVIDEFTAQFLAKKPGPIFEQVVACPNAACGTDIEFSFEGSDFFFPLPTRGRN